ncbi:MAG TPA: hypothetical protein VNY36_03055 [Bacteroidia bacterium]|jgi:hypothetical protein|nr:hypothetical protein [Bacteroidia bacterium]
MRKLLFILFILPACGTYAQKDSALIMPAYDTVNYQGYDVDIFCSLERKRAIRDIKAGRLNFIEEAIMEPRYKKDISGICGHYHLTYFYLSEDRLGYGGINPMRCYVATMDSALKAKLGDSVKTKLTRSADSCFWAHIAKDTVDEKYCNVPAAVPDESIYKNVNGEFFHIKCDTVLFAKFKKLSSQLANPYMFAGVLVEANGKVSTYRLTSFLSEGAVYYADTLKHSWVYDGCGEELWQLALKYLKKYPIWKPARLGNANVRTWHSFELVFEKEGE